MQNQTMNDIFDDEAFSLTSLTAAVNEMPVAPSQIAKSKLFQTEGIDTTTLMIEKQTGTNTLVAYTPRGGPGETVGDDQRNMRAFVVPHLQRDDTLMADQVQNVRAFAEASKRETIKNKVQQKMSKHITAIDMTIEHQRCGAMKGVVLDKFGNVMENLYSAFDVPVPPTINMKLNDDSTVVRKESDTVAYMMEDALESEVTTSVEAWCGRDFWDALINHKNVREIYQDAAKVTELLGKTPSSIQVGEITYHRYKISPSAKTASANGGGFIPMDKARVVPFGVPDMFITRFAPADYMETVNTMGLPRYAKKLPKRNDKGIDIEVQSNPISLCTRPQALFELSIAA